jgi:hypothetical protein
VIFMGMVYTYGYEWVRLVFSFFSFSVFLGLGWKGCVVEGLLTPFVICRALPRSVVSPRRTAAL